jgi:stress-induced-phosphoprotein 1
MADSKAAQLKDEGNKFFSQQDYVVQAFIKYSDAIAMDSTNAVLFANRAACCLAMKKCDSCEQSLDILY